MHRIVDFYSKLPKGSLSSTGHQAKSWAGRYKQKYMVGSNVSIKPALQVLGILLAVSGKKRRAKEIG